MKKPLYISLIVLLAQSAFPSIVAYDTAADATYNGGAYNGLNGGYGFQSWIVNTGGGGSGGSFLYTSSSNGGAPSGSIDTGGRSFGLYANGGNTTFASRYFARSTPLTSGYTIEADFDNGWIENGDSDAIGLLGGSATPRLIFYGGDNQYRFIDEAGNYHATGLGFTDGGVHVSFDLTSMGYDFKATRLADNSTYSYSSSKGLTAFGILAVDANAGYNSPADTYVNSLKVTQTTPEPATLAVLGLGALGLLSRRSRA